MRQVYERVFWWVRSRVSDQVFSKDSSVLRDPHEAHVVVYMETNEQVSMQVFERAWAQANEDFKKESR